MPAAVLAIVFVDLGGIGWMLLMAVLACACLSELYRMLPTGARSRSSASALDRYVPGRPLRNEPRRVRAPRSRASADVPGDPPRGQTGGATLSIASTLLGVFWIGFAFAHAMLLRQVPHGKGIMIDVMVGTFLGDTAAYLGGRLFGRHPLAPTISPKKTIEGLGCGALVSDPGGCRRGSVSGPGCHTATALLLGIAVAVLGPIGDLFESLMKRDVGAKDAGTLFGAHGGALDRLDAVMFTVVAGYYIGINIPR